MSAAKTGISGSPEPENRRRVSRMTILVILGLLIILTRLIPIAISSYPFNNDALTECRIADDIATAGNLDYPRGASYAGTHSVIMPVYNIVLAFVSSSIGVSAFDVAQFVTAALALLTVIGGYAVAIQITRGIRSGLMAAMTLAMFGTFLFVTGSTWKVSMGMALFTFLAFVYINRLDVRFFMIEIGLLLVLPFVHHLATAVAYLAVLFMTIWSFYFAVSKHRLRWRHVIDLVTILLVIGLAYAYYSFQSLDRLTLVRMGSGLVLMALAFIGVCVATIVVLNMKKHSRLTFAPLVAALLFILFASDYFGSLLTNFSGSPVYVLVLAFAASALAGVAWYGLEKIIESRSPYRVVPLCLLLPFLTLAGFAVLSDFSFDSQQMTYRSFDFADLSLALGVGFSASLFANKKVGRNLLIPLVLVLLVVTLPFSYASGPLIGVRHDTQEYEADAFRWLSYSAGSSFALQSDERLSYIAMALFDFDKSPRLPSRLLEEGLLGTDAFYAIEDEWVTTGVNDYPRGYHVISELKVEMTLDSSNVLYVGGPVSDRITIFMPDPVGQEIVFGRS